MFDVRPDASISIDNKTVPSNFAFRACSENSWEVLLIEFQPEGFRYPDAMPEHER